MLAAEQELAAVLAVALRERRQWAYPKEVRL
jgi:hypothetical protein